MKESTISIFEIIYTLKSKWRIIAITTLITTIMSSLYSFFFISPIYSSNLKVFIGKNNMDINNYSSEDITLYQNLAKTYTELIPTEDLIKKAIKNSNLIIDSKDVIRGLTIENNKDSQIISLTYINKELETSKIVLDSLTKEFIRESKELSPNINIKIIEGSKYPLYPDNFNSIRNIIIGIVMGIFLGVTIMIIMECISATFNNKDQIEECIGIPVIGIIPCNDDN